MAPAPSTALPPSHPGSWLGNQALVVPFNGSTAIDPHYGDGDVANWDMSEDTDNVDAKVVLEVDIGPRRRQIEVRATHASSRCAPRS